MTTDTPEIPAELREAVANMVQRVADADQSRTADLYVRPVADEILAMLQSRNLLRLPGDGVEEKIPYFDAGAFADRVKAKLIADDHSYRDAASIIGVSPATLNRVSHGHPPDVGTYIRITNWLRPHSVMVNDIVELTSPAARVRATPTASLPPIKTGEEG